MGLVLPLLSVKIDLPSRSGPLPLPILSPETLLARPPPDPRAGHREMFIRHVWYRPFQHPLEKGLGDFLVQQTLPILAEHRVIPDRLVHLHPHKPPEQQVVLELLDQHSLTAHRIEGLQQQRPKQSLRGNGWAPDVGVQLRKLRRHLLQNIIHHFADRSQGMIGRNSLFGGNVAEHSCLLVIVAAHSLVSLTFLHSDEFYQLKLQRNGIFQQTAKRGLGVLKHNTVFFSFLKYCATRAKATAHSWTRS